MDFVLNGTNINQYIRNKPKVVVANRDEFKYFTFGGAPLSLELDNVAAVNALLLTDAFLTVSRNSAIIWSGYYYKFGKVDRHKGEPLRVQFISELARLKSISFTHTGFLQREAREILDDAITAINGVLTGYSWSAEHILQTGTIELVSHQRPVYLSAPSGYPADPSFIYTSEEPFWVKDSSPFLLYVFSIANSTWYEIYNGYLDPQVGVPTNISAVTGTVDIPFLGTVNGIEHTDNDTDEDLKFYTINVGTNQWRPAMYGKHSPFDDPSVWYDDKTIQDVLIDMAKISDSLVYIVNKEIRFFNNQTSMEHDLSSIFIEKHVEKLALIDPITGLNLAITEDFQNGVPPIRSAGLAHYYDLKLAGEVTRHEMLLRLPTTNITPGYELVIDSVSYGRVTSVTYDESQPSMVAVKTENDNVV